MGKLYLAISFHVLATENLAIQFFVVVWCFWKSRDCFLEIWNPSQTVAWKISLVFRWDESGCRLAAENISMVYLPFLSCVSLAYRCEVDNWKFGKQMWKQENMLALRHDGISPGSKVLFEDEVWTWGQATGYGWRLKEKIKWLWIVGIDKSWMVWLWRSFYVEFPSLLVEDELVTCAFL